MAIPSAPTDTSIVTDALKKFGYATPTSSQVSLAISNGLEYVKRDIMDRGNTWKFLMQTSVFPTIVGVDRYAVPTDYQRFIQARLMDGASRGTAVGGSVSLMTLASTESTSSSGFQGNYLMVTTGAGANQYSQIQTYSASRVATFDRALSTAVDNTSQYLVVTDFWPLSPRPIMSQMDLRRPQILRMPTTLFYVQNDSEGDLYLDFTPDKVYGIELRYFLDLRKVDLSSTRYTTLLRRLAGVLTQGVFVWSLQDDSRYGEESGKYEKMLSLLGARELYGYDETNAQLQVND